MFILCWFLTSKSSFICSSYVDVDVMMLDADVDVDVINVRSISVEQKVLARLSPASKTRTLSERFDHTPDYDHTDDLMGLACCRRLNVFASASRDGTIRIWNSDNTLLRWG